MGQGVEISNLKVLTGGVVNSSTTAKSMYGLYTYSAPFYNLTSGLVMSTGRVLDYGASKGILNPSNVFASSGLSIGGEPFISGNTFDAVTIEFDIKPTAPILYFNYIFASEEYPEYVGSPFNDVFKFMITGPNPHVGIIPGATNYNKTNIAIVPGTGIPGTPNGGLEVAINSVNSGNPPTAASSPQYHDPNQSPDMVFDQRTNGLYAKANVIPLATYTLRLAIADRADAIFDSGVFIEKMNTNIPVFNGIIQQSAKLAPNTVTEGAETTSFKIQRPFVSKGMPETFIVEGIGTATANTDYELYEGTTLQTLPLTINFAAQELLKTYTLKIKNDALQENTEEAIIQIKSTTGILQYSTTYSILGGNTTFQNLTTTFTRCSPTQVIEFEAPDADSYVWDAPVGSYTCVTGDCRKISINPQTQLLTITCKLGYGNIPAGNTGIAQNITVQPAYMEVAGNTVICAGSAIKLTATGCDTYQWTPSTGLSCSNCANPIANPTTTTTYTLAGNHVACGVITQSVMVTVVNGVTPLIINNIANKYCVNAPMVELNGTPTGGTFSINGQTATNFLPATLGVGTHTIYYQKQEGTCLNNTSQSIEVIQGDVIINSQSTNQIIDLNNQAFFTVNATGKSVLAYQWQEKITTTFENIPTNTLPYSGVNTATLSITNIPYTLNNRSYRCAITDCGTTTYTNPAILAVNPNALPNRILDEIIALYPNPTKDKVWINTNQHNISEIDILSLEGKPLQKIKPQKINDTQYELSLAKLPKGAYLLKIYIGTDFVIKRLVRE